MEGVHDQSKGINPQGYPVTGFPDDGDVVMPLAASVKSTAPASSSEPNKPVVPTILGSFVQNEVEYVAMSNVQFQAMLDSIAKLERENGRLQAENCHLQTELKSAERVRERFRAAMAKGSFTADEPQEKGTGAGESSQSSHTLDTPMPSSEVLRQFTDADIIKVRKFHLTRAGQKEQEAADFLAKKYELESQENGMIDEETRKDHLDAEIAEVERKAPRAKSQAEFRYQIVAGLEKELELRGVEVE